MIEWLKNFFNSFSQNHGKSESKGVKKVVLKSFIPRPKPKIEDLVLPAFTELERITLSPTNSPEEFSIIRQVRSIPVHLILDYRQKFGPGLQLETIGFSIFFREKEFFLSSASRVERFFTPLFNGVEKASISRFLASNSKLELELRKASQNLACSVMRLDVDLAENVVSVNVGEEISVELLFADSCEMTEKVSLEISSVSRAEENLATWLGRLLVNDKPVPVTGFTRSSAITNSSPCGKTSEGKFSRAESFPCGVLVENYMQKLSSLCLSPGPNNYVLSLQSDIKGAAYNTMVYASSKVQLKLSKNLDSATYIEEDFSDTSS